MMTRPIRAQLAGNVCSAVGIAAKADAPILALCRKFLDAGHDPATPLEVYRGDVLALQVKFIGQAAGLRVGVSSSGTPVLRLAGSTPAAPPTLFLGQEAADGHAYG